MKSKKILLVLILLCSSAAMVQAQQVQIASDKQAWPIYVDAGAAAPIINAANLFAEDIERITGVKPAIINKIDKGIKKVIIAGDFLQSPILKTISKSGKLKQGKAAAEWDGFSIQMINAPMKGVDQALVITANQHRGVSFGLFHLSQMFGVSPWYWWADVPVVKKNSLEIAANYAFSDYPKVKYRGIFLNDEAPALSSWSKEQFGGFNHKFYSKVFELMLRLKANYIWPAMWGNAFYADDSLNIDAANKYGIVIGTSHHEPLMRAHDEWRRFGTGKWNYDSNAVRLNEFWKAGMQRATNEKIVTIGMRGDGDEPMSRETATSLLEKIVSEQRKIITDVTGKPAEKTPQLWALYKEVQDYYDKGMRVPDDVTLLLCDDNWGNIRRLPSLTEKPRKGGYGIYYHFDYVGGPRNYKWINTNHISRTWEQMHLAWQYKAREIWIVNVGDLKPMEFPISFFLDYAWNPEAIGADDLQTYTNNWSAKQFGTKYANEIGEVINKYTKYNNRRKHELLDARTFSVETGEWDRVVKEYNALHVKAEELGKKLPAEYQDAYYQLVLHPVQATANLYNMYHAVAMNQYYAAQGNVAANGYSRTVRQLFQKDSAITEIYHTINSGKWNHMMSQTHIGYTYWQQPRFNAMPATESVSFYNQREPLLSKNPPIVSAKSKVPVNATGNHFFEYDGYASIYADHFTRKQETKNIYWKVLPDHGRTGHGITTWPVTHKLITNPYEAPALEYDVYTNSKDSMLVQFNFSPTLNFTHVPEGFQFQVQINDEAPQIFSMNKFDYDNRYWEKWVASNVIQINTRHVLKTAGKVTIKYKPLHAGMVLQKIVIDFGGLQQSYLGPEETIIKNN